MGQAPHPLVFLGLAAVGVAGLASALNQPRQRSRSDWVASFSVWAGAASTAEDERIMRTERMVRDALSQSQHLSGFNFRIIPQGSSVNNTNIKLTSDLDLVVMNDELWYLPPSTQSSPRRFDSEYEAFRSRVLRALKDSFGRVEEGNKSLKVAGTDSTRVPCDVVPSFHLRETLPSANALAIPQRIDGVIFISRKGEQVINHPEQHLANGRDKNLATGYRYKQVVRIIKKLKTEFSASNTLLYSEPLPSSFEIEGVVFNAPDTALKSGELFDAVLATLKWADGAVSSAESCNKLVRVSRIGTLFPYWSSSAATILSVGTAQPSEAARFKAFTQKALRTISGSA